MIEIYRDKIDTLYIADGHHRSSTTLRLLQNHHLTGKHRMPLPFYPAILLLTN
ncbi:MAG: hypothetical protein IPG79_16685 [Saprospiraceae bacterium]|nr:hypothetical protein [Saprospiraceae bacterium]